MAADRRVYENWDQLRNPTLGNRVWATFTFLYTPGPKKGDTNFMATILCKISTSFDVLSLAYSLANLKRSDLLITPLQLARVVTLHCQIFTDFIFFSLADSAVNRC